MADVGVGKEEGAIAKDVSGMCGWRDSRKLQYEPGIMSTYLNAKTANNWLDHIQI